MLHPKDTCRDGLYNRSNGQYASVKVTESTFRNNTAIAPQESSRNSTNGRGVYMTSSNSSISVYMSDFLMSLANESGVQCTLEEEQFGET